MARKFLYIIATLIMLAVTTAFIYRIWGQQLITAAMVPSVAYTEPKPLGTGAYVKKSMWYARPDISRDNPALWTPKGIAANHDGQAAIFFIHPTSYRERTHWNAPLNDEESAYYAKLFIKGQASAFNGAGAVWAPRYRQATFGAFLTPKSAAQKAIDAAYRDVASAFAYFLSQNPVGPIILAAHSQGSLHLMRLLRDEVAGTPLARRIVAAYIVGWPVSIQTDLPALGLPACTGKDQANCILGWQSFAEPADTSMVRNVYDSGTGLTGHPRKGTRMLCTNPLTGAPDSAAAARKNLGTLGLADAMNQMALILGAVSARCDRQGFLLIGQPPELGPFVLPGNNYHVYDYGLFWANVRADANERLKIFLMH
ncbi:DUF3089 domain-containing protein [Rhizorhapis sp. SPR117]|uniref:DUF3089 domain-containing protein n=1 Tax=Rhizorhapis sp. SPR117 TaxID=2912611 RepID=UPI001F28AE1D|nr:DUF3089 domain-containing protein [Rhizorhapis sp. SPR117]